MVVQFICRGNAFRSIIAEAYLRSLRIPNLTVLSSGTVASTYKDSNQVGFPKTLALLKKHGIEGFAKDHYADDINQDLLSRSDIVIFLNKRAYDEAIGFRLPGSTYIWDVADLDERDRVASSELEREQHSEEVYSEITENIDALVKSAKLYSS
jgi:protein-tyrosine-phosphatase